MYADFQVIFLSKTFKKTANIRIFNAFFERIWAETMDEKMRAGAFERTPRDEAKHKGVMILPTIKDVARYACVSDTTVSKVLNNKGSISDETKNRVMEAVEKLDYIPNSAARALVRKKTDIIGVVLEKLVDPFYYDLLQGIEEGIADENYKLVYCNSGGSGLKRQEYINYLRQGFVDGVIIYGSYFSDEGIIRDLAQTKFPILVIENEYKDLDIDNLLIDNVSGAVEAVQYLINKGYTRIAHIVGNPNIKISIDRMIGYTTAMRAASLIIEEEYVVHSKMTYKSGYESMMKLLSLDSSKRPTAVFCVDDAVACGAIDAICDRGLKVPDDVAIVGFDDQKILPPDRKHIIPLTTVRQPLFDIGRDSIKTLVETINNPNKAKVKKLYQTELIVRESTK